jgi:hypothetical protein
LSAIRIGAHDGPVPRISYFYGIAITMYFYDHDPPHFHAHYAEHHAVIAIDDGAVLVLHGDFEPASRLAHH